MERPLWANSEFVRLWGAQVISSAGSGISRLALPLLVLSLTNSPAQAGLIAAAQSVPFIVLGLPAGALLDRWNRKVVMVICEITRFLAYASVPLAWMFGVLTTGHLYAVALVQGIAVVFFSIAQLAALPRVVPVRQIRRAHSTNTASEGVASLISPGIAGQIIALAPTTIAGGALAYLIDSVTCLVSAVSLSSIRTPFQAQHRPGPLSGLHRQIAEGLRYLWTRPELRALAVVNMFHRMCFAPVQLAVVVLATDRLHADARLIGLMFSAAGAGGIVASTFTPWLQARLNAGRIMLGLTAVHALSLVAIATAVSPLGVMAGLLVGGMMEVMTGIVQVTYRLAVIPDGMQGRVNSSYRFVSFTAITIGTAAGGVLLEQVGPRLVLGLLAVWIGLIAAGIGLSSVRRI